MASSGTLTPATGSANSPCSSSVPAAPRDPMAQRNNSAPWTHGVKSRPGEVISLPSRLVNAAGRWPSERVLDQKVMFPQTHRTMDQHRLSVLSDGLIMWSGCRFENAPQPRRFLGLQPSAPSSFFRIAMNSAHSGVSAFAVGCQRAARGSFSTTISNRRPGHIFTPSTTRPHLRQAAGQVCERRTGRFGRD